MLFGLITKLIKEKEKEIMKKMMKMMQGGAGANMMRMMGGARPGRR